MLIVKAIIWEILRESVSQVGAWEILKSPGDSRLNREGGQLCYTTYMSTPIDLVIGTLATRALSYVLQFHEYSLQGY